MTRSITVVLPAPDGPTIAVIPPAGIVSATLRRIHCVAIAKAHVVEADRLREHGRHAIRRILALALRPLDRRLHRPVRALARDHPLVFALHAAHVQEHAHEQEREEHHRGERHPELHERHVEARRDQDGEHRLLQRAQRLLAEDVLLQRAVQLRRVALEQRVGEILAGHRLQRLDRLQVVGKAREQRAQEPRLLRARRDGTCAPAGSGGRRTRRRRRAPRASPATTRAARRSNRPIAWMPARGRSRRRDTIRRRASPRWRGCWRAPRPVAADSIPSARARSDRMKSRRRSVATRATV